MRVKITFFVEADDPDHSTGLSVETYESIADAVMSVGGDDMDIEVEDD